MNKEPKISVITPAYNAEKYISECIESILSQTYTDFEYIIIDDCSTDNTWEVIRKYAEKDKRIVSLKNDKNLGIAGNRNKGVSVAKGKYIAWQDADDISMNSRLEKQCSFLDKNPSVGIVGGYLQFFNENDGDQGIRKYAASDEELRKNIFRYSPVAQPSAMLRKEALDKAGEYNLKYPPAEDLDMSFRIGENYNFANLQEVVVKYREHPSSATFTRLKKIETSTIEIRRKYAKNTRYNPGILDYVYNIAQFISIYTVPPKFKIWLFNLIRNSK